VIYKQVVAGVVPILRVSPLQVQPVVMEVLDLLTYFAPAQTKLVLEVAVGEIDVLHPIQVVLE
jgi:hypothetical protein